MISIKDAEEYLKLLRQEYSTLAQEQDKLHYKNNVNRWWKLRTRLDDLRKVNYALEELVTFMKQEQYK